MQETRGGAVKRKFVEAYLDDGMGLVVAQIRQALKSCLVPSKSDGTESLSAH